MERANESAVFISDEVRFGVRLSLYGGIRYSFFAMYGPYNYNTYLPDQPINLENQVGTDIYGNEIVNHYHGPEYRFSLRYRFGRNNAVKLSYNRMRQYLHMISNTTSISPTDTWKLSDPYIKPQISDQVALGLYKNNKRGTIETSAEIYYKKIKDIIEYKSGAVLVMNSHLETDLINGNGKAYGLELLLKKTSGKLNGWIAYTYSRILIQVNGLFQDEKINEGLYFPANHDKPHDFTTVINYKFNRRLNLSNNITYSTGRPITYPVAKYNYRNYTLLHYSNRNEYRVPDYFRWDISINIEGNLKSKKIAHSSWSLGVYNVTGRKNVYSIFFVSREGFVKGYKMSVFARPIFTVSYNIKF